MSQSISLPFESAAAVVVETPRPHRPVSMSLAGRARRAFYHCALRLAMGIQYAATGVGRRLVPHRRTRGRGRVRVVVTGRTFNANWPVPHLLPMAASEFCEGVTFVSADPVTPMPKVKVVAPPPWLVRVLGASPARMITFALTVLRERPDIVAGFHMKVNALVAITLARLTGARGLYFCVGGPVEVLDGGVWGEANTFERMETPDAVVERRLVSAAASADVIVTMGTRAERFFRGRGVTSRIDVLPGGIDSRQYSPGAPGPRPTDVVFVGRLVEVKRVDVLLDALRLVADELPGVRAAIVGGGSRMDQRLRLQAHELGLEENVTFVGHSDDVPDWLRQSKVFALTSDSEGLSLALMQAMMVGLPAVVTNVGDLGDLVQEGVNGHLVPRRCPQEVARKIVALLRDDARREQMAKAARESAMRFSIDRTIRRWDSILQNGSN